VCDPETSRIGAPYIYDISSLRVKGMILIIYLISMKVNVVWENITSKNVRGGSTDLERENVRKYSRE